MDSSNRILVKLRPTTALGATDTRTKLCPLYETLGPSAGFGIDSEPQWFLAELPDGAENPWDLARRASALQEV